MPTKPAPNAPEWIDSLTAAEMLGVPRHTIAIMARRGQITTRDLPTHARFLRADVERLKTECVRPATASASK